MASRIELLPHELLQEIFRLSENICLPMSSFLIAQKLSTKYCYTLLCQFYLFKDWRHEKTLKSAQAWIFERRWMTWEFFKDFLAQTCHGDINKPITFPKDAQDAKDSTEGAVVWGVNVTNPYIQGLNCRIPKKLLHGPWTQSKIDFLRFLVKHTDMKVDWADRDTRLQVTEGKREAITEKSYEAVELFCNDRTLGKAPSLDQVKFAVMEAGCDRTIVYTLMTSARKWGLRRWLDLDLDAWVKEARERNDRKGDWLALKLDELRIPGGFPSPETGNYEAPDDVLHTNFYDRQKRLQLSG